MAGPSTDNAAAGCVTLCVMAIFIGLGIWKLVDLITFFWRHY